MPLHRPESWLATLMCPNRNFDSGLIVEHMSWSTLFWIDEPHDFKVECPWEYFFPERMNVSAFEFNFRTS
ncbi:hypothetical protein, partial [Gelidibacter salicanalis]|uniref:hypothetical protein n=1 Tax=Gelidibacter salicanalis TaxID=291193 RepID=UPI001F3C967E